MAEINVTIKTPEWDTVIRYTDGNGRQVQQSIYGEQDGPTALARRALEMRANIAQVTIIRGAAEESTYGHGYGHAVLEIPKMFARYTDGWQQGTTTRVGGVECEGYGGTVQIISADTGGILMTLYGMPEKYRPRDRAAA